ncbi:MAG: VgrG-related protein, partial [Anaerolineae bacterium]|nr:VgrG-related protein [Anaerolineae bacterium]
MGFNINTKVIVQIGLIPDLGIFSDIVEVVVDTNVHLPGMCTITFAERPGESNFLLEHVDNALKYNIGTDVTVSVITESVSAPTSLPLMPIFSGEITSIEPVFEKSGRILLRIRAFDKGHRLTKGKKFRSFAMVSDGVIVNKILAAVGLVAKVSPDLMSNIYTHVLQYDQSDWDFLWERAQLYGCQMYVDVLGIFHFEPIGIPNNVVKLSWGEDLVQFEPRLVSMGQVTDTAVGGWDPSLKMPIVGRTPGVASVPINFIGNAIPGPVTNMAAFSKQTDYIVDKPIENIGQAMKVSRGLLEDHATQFVRASGEVGTCIPTLLAGATATITNVGIRFAGTYYVSEAKHVYRNGDYRIYFQVTGQNPYTFRHLINGDEVDKNRIKGVVVGIVTNVQDPLRLGRVKVKFPWIPMNDIESDWARVASIGGGSAGGVMFLPEVNDEVLVTFEHGDINAPYVVGLLWNGKDRPPSAAAVGPDSKINQRVIKSRSGHTIILDDTMGKEQIIIQDKSTRNSIVIDSVKNAMTIKAQGDLSIEAGGRVTINGMAMTLTGKQS